MSSLFPSLSANGNPLAVRGPNNVLYLSSDGLVLVLENVLFLSGVPYPDLARSIWGKESVMSTAATVVHLLKACLYSAIESFVLVPLPLDKSTHQIYRVCKAKLDRTICMYT